ncbi:UNVERIFIED_CONTAM: bifunctional hydroxymethylpyrimidine kinase/phosphomethylpyrimidine kinase, partial [Lacticaseibacillus paracasei]|nr:bifunctional hydroxymethylpyrimidine kinase/phosphomethylpyrimidine kinase [Lacticaseibacillus paracasei]
PDSDGSAGVQADLHSFFIRCVYGATILTAAVSGNSYGFLVSFVIPLPFIYSHFKSLAADFHIRSA